MDTLEEKIIEAFRNNTVYDFIANNAHLMSKEQLKRIAMECIYEIGHYDEDVDMRNNIADELYDCWNY